MTESIRLDPRANGPRGSANGGFACGRFAAAIGGTATVTLLAPPPLDVPLTVFRGDDDVEVSYEGRPIATLRPAAPFELEPPVLPTPAGAADARRAHPALPSDLSDCLVCSPTRGDGMQVTPGPLAGYPGVLAAPYEPHEREAVGGWARPESVWGALDCPSYPAEAMLAGRLALLGRLTVHRVREIAVGEPLIVVGWTRDRGRRSVSTASVIIDAAGAVAASAEAVWVERG